MKTNIKDKIERLLSCKTTTVAFENILKKVYLLTLAEKDKANEIAVANVSAWYHTNKKQRDINFGKYTIIESLYSVLATTLKAIQPIFANQPLNVRICKEITALLNQCLATINNIINIEG